MNDHVNERSELLQNSIRRAQRLIDELDPNDAVQSRFQLLLTAKVKRWKEWHEGTPASTEEEKSHAREALASGEAQICAWLERIDMLEKQLDSEQNQGRRQTAEIEIHIRTNNIAAIERLNDLHHQVLER